MQARPGFTTEELRARYDVEAIQEDAWHSYSGRRTAKIVGAHLSLSTARSRLLLNAGAGVHKIEHPEWEQVSVDLFATPIRSHGRTVCANVEQLPFLEGEYGAVVCVGEVLGYCDPARAISEFGRVLERRGVLICDFGSSRSARHWFTPTQGRTAHLTTDYYNGSSERIWVYDPDYIRSILKSCGFKISRQFGTHTWSSLIRKIGISPEAAVLGQKCLNWLPAPAHWADLTTIVAVRS